MPIYAGVLSQEQIDSLLLYMKALAGENGPVVLTSDDPSAVATVDHQWKVNDFQKSLSGPLRDRSFDQGKMVFLGAACFSCHQVGEGKGGQIGPDLAKLNEKMRGMELLNHILEPSQRIVKRSFVFIGLCGTHHARMFCSFLQLKCKMCHGL